jgi:hypothetical protein
MRAEISSKLSVGRMGCGQDGCGQDGMWAGRDVGRAECGGLEVGYAVCALGWI